jgi:hypothetical protein
MTTKHGYLGSAPDNMHGHDADQVRLRNKIAIIFGCNTPDCYSSQVQSFFGVKGGVCSRPDGWSGTRVLEIRSV